MAHPQARHGSVPGAGRPEDAVFDTGCETGGVCKRLDAETMVRSPGVAAQVRRQVFDVLVNGFELCVTVNIDAAGRHAVASLSAACEILAQAASDAGVSPARLEIVIDNPAISPAQAAAIRRDTIGDGFVHVVAGQDGPAAAQARFWEELWEGAAATRLRVAYAAPVRAASALLRSEPATALLPRTHIEVPAGTAWVLLRVHLGGLGNGGEFCVASLERSLRQSVEEGEYLHDRAVWATPAMRDDAWLNRRIAIVIDGIGDLVVEEGLDPAAFSTLEFLDRLLQRVQAIVRDQSRAIADRTARVPALDQTDPCRFLPRSAVRDVWRRRWTEMLATAAVRHRNLLAIAPWSVFPARVPADFRFADLLPVLRYADACMLSGAPDMSQWNVNKFRYFHRRASAVLQQRESRHQIAEGC